MIRWLRDHWSRHSLRGTLLNILEDCRWYRRWRGGLWHLLGPKHGSYREIIPTDFWMPHNALVEPDGDGSWQAICKIIKTEDWRTEEEKERALLMEQR